MILLDDAQSTATHPTSRLYRSAKQYWRVLPSGNVTTDEMAIHACIEELSKASAKGQYLVVAFAYELGRSIHKLPYPDQASDAHPLIEAWSFDSVQKQSKEAVDQFISQELSRFNSSVAGVLDVQESLTQKQFCDDVAKIQEYIRSGDTYQINHTYRIRGQTYGSPLALYNLLRNRQPGRFGAYIAQDNHYLLSQSPELFIERKGDTLTAMPMKGTASALSTESSSLADDPKNQAENVMIVDLLRNDLSKISLPNSVSVPHLFEVARHGDVLQMTSTVQSQAKPNTTLMDVLNAVFPCGSVTGAPKKRSMEIIQELEPDHRGYYCGALGWIDPNGDFAFSVPIRTVEIEVNPTSKSSTFTLGVGAGITIDSDAKQEWQECQIKSAFLSKLPSGVGIFETIAVLNQQPQRIEEHLDRMQASAKDLGITFNRPHALNAVLNACRSLEAGSPHRLRLDLNSNGEMQVSIGLLDSMTEPVKIFWAKDILTDDCTMHSGDALLRHKVNMRHIYDLAWQTAVKLGGFDAIFVNEQGLVTEGGRSSIFIKPKAHSQWLTPPISAGLLPGVMRSTLLSDPLMNAREANLTINDVSMADEIILCNALRGVIKAHF